MRKKSLIFFIVATFILGACSSRATPPTGEAYGTQTAGGTASLAPQKATLPATPSPSQPPAGTGSAELANAGCTVQSPFPTPGPTEQSLFPPPGENDWVSGPAGASVIFTEYSDFQ